jgi:hypothetical protein
MQNQESIYNIEENYYYNLFLIIRYLLIIQNSIHGMKFSFQILFLFTFYCIIISIIIIITQIIIILLYLIVILTYF